MTNVSIVIPIAPYHMAIASQAIASANAQTVACTVIPIYDAESKGAGAARNAGLSQVTTPFVVFLDADDLIAPDFVAECLKIWTPNRYVYTDVMFDDTAMEMPDCAWIKGYWHVNTALLPTEWVKTLGGYDEHLPGAEDTDFYFRLTRAGCCGIHLKQPLFTYRRGGQRAESFVLGEHHIKVLEGIRDKYKEYPMGCCGDNPQIDIPPANEAQPGYVKVVALWAGNRSEFIEGFRTPRISAGRTFYMPAQLVGLRPDLVRLAPVENAAPTPQNNGAVYPRANSIADLGKRLFNQPMPQTAPEPKTAPDVQTILERAKRVWNE